MKICMDIQAAVAQRAGIGRYTRMLAEHLPPYLNGDSLSLFYFDFKRQGEPFHVDGADLHPCRMLPGQIVQRLWRTADWPDFRILAGDADVYHFPNFLIPPLSAPARSVVSIHDMSFIRHPEFAEDRNREFLAERLPQTIERADAIITISEFSAKEITSLTGASPDQVHVTYPGIRSSFAAPSPGDIQMMRDTLQIDGPYLLTLSTLEPRKNVDFLIDVFEKMNDFDGKLVIAGMRGWKYEATLEKIRNSPAAERILYVEYVDDVLLPSLYADASLFLFGSHYEGFGFTPLEAMACGLPVLSSGKGSLTEVLKDGAEVLQNFNTEEWSVRATNLLGDEHRRATLVERGKAVAASYTWQETAKQTASVYREIAS